MPARSNQWERFDLLHNNILGAVFSGYMSHRKQRMAAQIGEFLRQYRRKSQRGIEPNDRQYSRKFEQKLKRMRPEELDELLNGYEEGEGEPQRSPPARKPECETRWDGR